MNSSDYNRVARREWFADTVEAMEEEIKFGNTDEVLLRDRNLLVALLAILNSWSVQDPNSDNMYRMATYISAKYMP